MHLYVPWPFPCRARPAPAPPEGSGRQNRSLGRRGERIAAAALRKRGYRLLGRNVRTPAAEIDLLMVEGGQLVLVEVKSSARSAGAALARRVGHRQRRRLRRAGPWLCRRLSGGPRHFRIDLVTVTFDGRPPVVTIRRAAVRP